jgi:hypothetical protein
MSRSRNSIPVKDVIQYRIYIILLCHMLLVNLVVLWSITIVPCVEAFQSTDCTNLRLLDRHQMRYHHSNQVSLLPNGRTILECNDSTTIGQYQRRIRTTLFAVGQTKLSEAAVQKGIDQVVAALRKDPRANQELGKLQRVTKVLGYGTQQMDTILAVRFNASFQKSGFGLSSVPLPFGLGQSNVSEGRGTMIGQVKASVQVKTGKVISCSVFRDLGYGRTFDLRI